MCSKYANHLKIISQHDWGDLDDHSMSMRIFALIMNKDFQTSSNNHKGNGYGERFGFANHLDSIACFISHKEVGAERNVSK